MVAAAVTLASVITGWVSFALTILTWLGVYVSLLKTFRSAPRAIPIGLGNLRQEIQSERSMLRQRMKEGDRYHVFRGRQMKKVGKAESHIRLVEETLKSTWKEFQALEKRFLVQGSRVGDVEDADADGMWEEESDKEKEKNGFEDKYHSSKAARTRGGGEGSGSRRLARRDSHLTSRMGAWEAGLSIDRQTYYNTDMRHRFLWWWVQEDFRSLTDRIQRIMLRRTQHDVYETDELVKRGLSILGGLSGEDPYTDCGEGKGPQGGGGAGGGVRRRRSHRSSKGSRFGSRRASMSAANASGVQRSRNTSQSRDGVREVYEKEIRRVRRRSDSEESARSISSSPPRPPTSPQVAKVAGSTVSMSRRGDSVRRSRGPSVVEYEVVNPGRMWVDVDPRNGGPGGSAPSRRVSRPQAVHDVSYVRERPSIDRMRQD